jgi:hypothetical protein
MTRHTSIIIFVVGISWIAANLATVLRAKSGCGALMYSGLVLFRSRLRCDGANEVRRQPFPVWRAVRGGPFAPIAISWPAEVRRGSLSGPLCDLQSRRISICFSRTIF